jgi:hypothetical protein
LSKPAVGSGGRVIGTFQREVKARSWRGTKPREVTGFGHQKWWLEQRTRWWSNASRARLSVRKSSSEVSTVDWCDRVATQQGAWQQGLTLRRKLHQVTAAFESSGRAHARFSDFVCQAAAMLFGGLVRATSLNQVEHHRAQRSRKRSRCEVPVFFRDVNAFEPSNR